MTESQVGNEMTVHNVQMQIVRSIVKQSFRFCVQLGQVRVQYRGSNSTFHCIFFHILLEKQSENWKKLQPKI